MVKCLKCNKEIETLNYTQSCIAYGVFDKFGEYEEINCELDNNNYNKFICPKCDCILFDDEDDAKEFLNKEVD